MFEAACRSLSRWFVIPVSLLAAGTVVAQGAGSRGPSYAGASSYPTGSKAESKLWWNDGAWWSCMWSASARSYSIHRLDGTNTWVDAGVAVDPRANSRSDCLWDGAKLYVASHEFTTGFGSAGAELNLYRYSYAPATDTYALDVGFPTLIGDSTTEVLVLDKDSTGTLWAAWTAAGNLWIAHTNGDDRSWSVPVVLPGLTAPLAGDDICSIVSFQGNKLGVLWSDQVTDSFRFSFHRDGQPDTTWSPVETVVARPGVADDHISLRAARDGRLFVALKATTNQILLGERSAAGVWTGTRIADAQDRWTRPVLVLDEQHRMLHVFGTSPTVLGTIYEKVASMDGATFVPGLGRAVIRDERGPSFNDATSTKQSVSGATGLVVLASHQVVHAYGFHRDTLGGATPSAPVAAFSPGERTGPRPLTVRFLDSSSGQPTQWLWNFGDGATSAVQHPFHIYNQAGQYTVSLQVTNALGTNTLTRANLIVVVPPPTSLVLRPVADGHVRQASPAENYGDLPEMRVRTDGIADYHSYLKFFVPPGPARIGSATLRLFCTDGGPDGGSLFRVADAWTEPGISWADAPALAGAPVGSFGSVATGVTAQVDLSSLVTKSGTLSLGLRNASTNSIFYSTRQGANAPVLELALLAPLPGPPAAGFEANRTQGDDPLTVQFFDTSNGPVTTWSWDFGDGTTSHVQNPSHAYTRPGPYTVRLMAANSSGANTLNRSNFVNVTNTELHASRTPGGVSTVIQPLGSGFPGLPGPGCSEHDDALELQGSLADVLDYCRERLSAAGIEIVSGERDSRNGSVELELRSGSRVGRLLLRSESPEHVIAHLCASPE